MRKLWIFSLILLVQCTSKSDKSSETFTRNSESDTASLLYQYWIMADADHPLGRDIISKEDGKDNMPGIVFINNGEILENPGGIPFQGKYDRIGDSIHVTYDDGKTGDYRIKKLNKDTLFLNRNLEGTSSQLLYNATNTWWPDAKTNPFTAENFAWTKKPAAPESEDQIRQRCSDYIRFCQYYLEGHTRGGATKISFVGFPVIYNFYTGGVGIQSDKKLNQKWVDCFYNEEQAMEGYAMLRHNILKKYKWDPNETNWIKQTAPVLAAMRDSLGVKK